MDQLASMQVFTDIVDLGGLLRASRALGVPRSAILRSITLLESQLGTPLFRCASQSVSLTEEGIYYYGICKRVLLSIAAADSAVVQE